MTAIRLTLSVQEGKPQLVSQMPVTMRAPPARNLSAIDTEAGTWVETRDRDGNRLYARIIQEQALSPMIEVRTGVGVRTLEQAKGSAARPLHIVVPVNDDTRSFHLMQRSARGGDARVLISGDL